MHEREKDIAPIHLRSGESIDLPVTEGPIPVPAPPAANKDYWIRRRVALLVSMLAIAAVVIVSLPFETRLRLLTGFFEQRMLIVLLSGFSLVTLSLLWSAGQRLDVFVFLAIHRSGLRSRKTDWSMFALTQIGNGLFALVLALIFYLTGDRRLSLILLLGALSLWIVVEAIKLLTFRTRPFLLFAETQLVGWKERGRSFPSGHSAQTFFMTGLILDYFGLGLPARAIGWLVALLVGFSRVYMGVHYPRDVIAGGIVGGVWATLGGLLLTYLLGGPV